MVGGNEGEREKREGGKKREQERQGEERREREREEERKGDRGLRRQQTKVWGGGSGENNT